MLAVTMTTLLMFMHNKTRDLASTVPVALKDGTTHIQMYLAIGMKHEHTTAAFTTCD